MINRLLNLATVLSVGVLSISLAYRDVLLNDFSMLPGDRYDMAIMSTILEHWHNVFTGHSSWHNVGYFHPYGRTIAQTDAYFLIGVLFSAIRFFQEDLFKSVAITSITLSALGFISLFYLSKEVLKLKTSTSLLISAAYVLLNSIASHNQRLQLLSVYFLPAQTILLLAYIRSLSLENRNKPSTLTGCAFSASYGALTLTCFYVAWFFAIFLLITLVILAFSYQSTARHRFSNFIKHKASSTCVVIVTIFSVMPFIWAYLPKSLEVGVRSFSSVSGNLILPLELVQVGFDNYLYGNALKYIFKIIYPDYQPWGEYYNVGFTPFVFLLFTCSITYFGLRRKIDDNKTYLVVGASAFFCCLLTIKYGDFLPWYFVYSYIPGAKALNVVSSFLIVLSLPVLIVVGKYIDSQKLHPSLLIPISALIITGELTPSYINFNRSVENERISNIPTPPASCQVFYVSAHKDQENLGIFPEWINSMYAHNVTAMLISQTVRIPTINGIASFNPPDWNFSAPWKDDYDKRVLSYAAKHNVNNLCKLDLSAKIWTIIN